MLVCYFAELSSTNPVRVVDTTKCIFLFLKSKHTRNRNGLGQRLLCVEQIRKTHRKHLGFQTVLSFKLNYVTSKFHSYLDEKWENI